jgi:hypothetical protein
MSITDAGRHDLGFIGDTANALAAAWPNKEGIESGINVAVAQELLKKMRARMELYLTPAS